MDIETETIPRSRRNNILRSLFQRQEGNRASQRNVNFQPKNFLSSWVDRQSVISAKASYIPLPRSTKSTISTSFSPNGEYLATTHGDHTVKIISFHSGVILNTLVGHPRTPWTVKFHPRESRLLASGCIGCEVRIWDSLNSRCLHMAKLDFPVISLTFHPDGELLAIATFHSLWLWPYGKGVPLPYLEWQSTRLLRCVFFSASGKQIILGLGNEQRAPFHHEQEEGGSSSSHHQRPRARTFNLIMWDFDLKQAYLPLSRRGGENNAVEVLSIRAGGQEREYSRQQRSRTMMHPRTLLERALLYNDGGLDISRCGRYLITCAELDDDAAAAGEEESCSVADGPRSNRNKPYLVQISLSEDSSSESACMMMDDDSTNLGSIPSSEARRSSCRAPGLLMASHCLEDVLVGCITSIKISASGSLVILGYGVRDSTAAAEEEHQIASIYATGPSMKHIRTIMSTDDDVNIACFHPQPGHGFIYGTKQGRVCMFTPSTSNNRIVCR